MEKPAETAYPIAEVIARRWSPRAFIDREVSEQDLGSLLEAARWAPSCFNEQPWRFIVGRGRDSENHKKIVEVLAPANTVWAANAPLLLITVASTTFAHNDKPNQWASHDVGLAVGALSVQATSMGLSLHQMAGFDADAARKTFAIPERFQPITAIAVGYRGEADALPENLAERERGPRSRKSLKEIVFDGDWI